MAYQPISRKKKSEYVSVRQKKVEPKNLDGFFPATQMVKDVTARSIPAPQKSYEELTGLKKPFAATKTGVAVNTVLGLPKSALKVGKDIIQGTARGAATTGTYVSARAIGQSNEQASAQEFNPDTRLKKVLFGKTPFSVKTEAIDPLVSLGASKEAATKFGAPLLIGMTTLDLFTGPKRKVIEESLVAANDLNTARKVLKDSGFTDEAVKSFKLDEKVISIKSADQAKTFIDEIKTAGPTSKAPTSVPPTQALPPAKTTPAKEAIAKGLTEDEYVKGQGTPILHFTKSENVSSIEKGGLRSTLKSDIKITDGISLATKRTEANEIFGNAEIQVYINPKAKSITLKEALNKMGFADETDIGVIKNIEKQAPAWARENGFDVLDMREARGPVYKGMDEIRVLNPDVLKTTSQLRAEYQAANGAAPTPTPTPTTPELPALPKLTPEVSQAIRTGQADETVNRAILDRYKAAARRPVTENSKLAEAAKNLTEPNQIVKLTGELLTPISSRLRRINPTLETGIRKMEFAVNQNTFKDMASVTPLLRASAKMTPTEQTVFSLSRLNGDREVYEALAVKYGFEKELKQSEATISGLLKRGNEVGMEIVERQNYHPRIVKNPKKYIAWWRGQEDWGDIERLIDEEAKKKGITYGDLWKDEEKVTSIINNYIRGYGNKTVLAAPSFSKQRTISVLDEELAEYYESADTALTTYIVRMNDEIEGRRFFGKKADGNADIQDTIGAYVMRLVAEKKISPIQQQEVSDIFKSRFQRGSMNGALDLYRNLEYISTMGSPISAITQIADFSWSLYDNGFWQTAKAAVGKKRLTREQLGLDMSIMNEFTRDTWSGKGVEKVFKAVGLDQLARLGQETQVNAMLGRLKNEAAKNDPILKMKLEQLFDADEAALAMDEFAKGLITDRTKFVAFNRLLDFQPLTKSEMPQIYLERPNGRIFYMLKTFTLKQYDIYRREGFDLIASGDPTKVKQGVKNLMKLATLFIAANATADEIKDLVLDRDTPPSDRVVDNLWRLVGASKFDVYQARDEGLGSATMKKILFPASIVDRLGKDIYNTAIDKEYEKGPLKGEDFKLESTQTIPVGGKLYYWWLGRGAQKEEQKEETAAASESGGGLPQLPKLPQVEGAGLPKLPKIGV